MKINEELESQQNKAWELLENKGLTLGEKVSVRSAFASTYLEEIPFVELEYDGGEIKWYRSSHKPIAFMVFQTLNEVYLANALYTILGDGFEVNEFVYQYRLILRMLRVESNWCE